MATIRRDGRRPPRPARLTPLAPALAAALSLAPAQGQPASPATAPDAGPAERFPDEYAAEPERHPFLERRNAHDWMMRVETFVSFTDIFQPDVEPIDMERPHPSNPDTDEGVDIERGAIIWPFVIRSASAETEADRITGRLRFNQKQADVEHTFLTGYHSGQSYASWAFPRAFDVEDIRLTVEVPVTCYDTVFDEEAAMEIGWPEQWPPVARSTFQPQQFIDFDAILLGSDRDPSIDRSQRQLLRRDRDRWERLRDRDIVADTVKRWFRGNDPRDHPPVWVAKYLAQQVAREIQPRGEGIIRPPDGLEGTFRGIIARGPVLALDAKAGSPFDWAATLVAVYREAGLPARLVIGYAVQPPFREPGEVMPDPSQLASGLYPWVEFCLYDPDAADGAGLITWVPVDIIQMRGSGAHTQPLDRPWPFFGTHEGLNDIVPFAYGFHPFTEVVSYDFPAMYGLRIDPVTPRYADHHQLYDVMRQSKTTRDVREADRRYGRPDRAR